MITACNKNDCATEIGDTFNSISSPDLMYNSDSSVINFRLAIDANSQLPNNYYSGGTYLRVPESSLTLDSAKTNSTELNLFLNNTDLPQPNEEINVLYTLFYPSRNNYVDCKNINQADSYELTLSYTILNNNNTFEILNFNWSENYRPSTN